MQLISSKHAVQAVVAIGILLAVAVLLTYFVPFFLSRYRKFEFIHVIEVEALLLSIFALIFAVRQFRDSAEVSKQLSTRFLSIFPGNMQDIIAFVAQSTDNLDIMVDYAGYGIYSDPHAFSRYCEALESRARVSEVRILLYANELARQALKQQWPEKLFQKEEKESPMRLERFLDHHQGLIRPKSTQDVVKEITYDLFIELILRAQVETQHRLGNHKSIKIRFIDDTELVVLAWIRPDHHAIFTFKNRGLKTKKKILRELAFQTRDTALVDVLQDLFDQHWNAADPAVKKLGQKVITEGNTIGIGATK